MFWITLSLIVFTLYYCFVLIYELLFKIIDENIIEKKETKTSYKSDVFLKVVRAKLTCTWEGGGIGGGENSQNKWKCN